MQQYKIIVSNRAKEEMGNHVAFLANTSTSAAKKLKEELIKSIKSLALLKTNRYDKMKNMEEKKYVRNADERKK